MGKNSSKYRGSCLTCGGQYDKRFLKEPCPECGQTYGQVNLDKLTKEEEEKVINSINILNIPEVYKNVYWSRTLLEQYKQEEKTDLVFKRYVEQLDRIHTMFSMGNIPAKSGLIIAPPGMSKMTWAYSCMQLALIKGYTVAPMLDTTELKRMLVLASERPFYKLYDKMNFDEYITSDVCFITVTKTYNREQSYEVILDILDKRARKGLPTFILSRFDFKNLSGRDFAKHFESLKSRYNQSSNPLKYPVIVQYFKGFS